MMINQNKAMAFYGQRPSLANQLPAHVSGRIYRDLGALGQAVGQLYMPASAGAKAVGSIMDGIGKLIKDVVYKIPFIGQVLEAMVNVLDLILTPMGNLMEGMAIGAATYLETAQAQAVLDDMEKNRLDYIRDAFFDCFYAFYRRIGSTGQTVLDIKEGRSGAIQAAIGAILDNKIEPVGRNSNRVANRVYTKAMGAGAKDWQAAAAVCYGLLTGLQTQGFPSGFKFTIKGVNIATVGSGPDTSKAMWALGNDFDALYFSKLGTPVKHDLAWVESQYKLKSGGAIGDTKDKVGKSAAGGGAVPLLAIAAAAFLALK